MTPREIRDAIRDITHVFYAYAQVEDIVRSYALPESLGPALWEALDHEHRRRFVALADADLLEVIDWPRCECHQEHTACFCLAFAEKEQGEWNYCLECLEGCKAVEDDCPHCDGTGIVKITRKQQKEKERILRKQRESRAALARSIEKLKKVETVGSV